MNYDSKICAWPSNVPPSSIPWPQSSLLVETNIIYPDRYMSSSKQDEASAPISIFIFFATLVILYGLWSEGCFEKGKK